MEDWFQSRILEEAIANSNNDRNKVNASNTVDTVVTETDPDAKGDTSPEGAISSKPSAKPDSSSADNQKEGSSGEQDWITVTTRSKAQASDFINIVRDVWQVHISGYAMFRVSAKLKLLKEPLK
ncbi:hypothetical protein RIF29_03317 [Crotalaria pallida]|uniref:Uncharacterized protein n=1 Tax=Crotalaria pallida TaxID=3830 RepID=A0AAN9IZU0_CROPI